MVVTRTPGTVQSVHPALRDVQVAMPIVADLLRCDVVLYQPVGGSAVAVAEATPETVPSIYAEPRLGSLAGRAEEPAVIQVLSTGRPARRLSRVLVQGAPTVQDVFPIVRDGLTIAAMVCEVGLIELERQRRRSPIYRRAVDTFRLAATRGEVVAVEGLKRLAEHDGPLVVDASGQILYISSIAENLYRRLGYARSLLGRNVAQLQSDESAYFQALDTGACVEMTTHEGAYVWHRWALPLPADHLSGWLQRIGLRPARSESVLLIVRDVTEERQKEQELRIKSAMIQEIHHRVKNNLQTIAALLRLQARRTGSAEVGDMLRQTINRILSIAVVHEFLSHDESSIVDVREICQRIVGEVTQGILDPEKQIRFTIEGPVLALPAQQATSCALIVNELLQNAVKHAFHGRSEGSVAVSLHDDGDTLSVQIVDDGRGVGPGFDRRHEGSLGLQIVRTLVRDDLRGEFDIGNREEGGLRATVTFPKIRKTTI